MSANPRIADYAINEQFINRWSPRAFTGEPISQETLLSFLEAARWAPSAYNSQPWRFLVRPPRHTELGAPPEYPQRVQPQLGAARFGAGTDHLQDHLRRPWLR